MKFSSFQFHRNPISDAVSFHFGLFVIYVILFCSLSVFRRGAALKIQFTKACAQCWKWDAHSHTSTKHFMSVQTNLCKLFIYQLLLLFNVYHWNYSRQNLHNMCEAITWRMQSKWMPMCFHCLCCTHTVPGPFSAYGEREIECRPSIQTPNVAKTVNGNTYTQKPHSEKWIWFTFCQFISLIYLHICYSC